MKLIHFTPIACFLKAVASLPTNSPSTRLDWLEEQLLNYIFLATARGEGLLVGQVILVKQFGSQATLHGRLKNLVRKGYIRLLEDKEDGRRKLVHLTAKADNHYEQLSKCLILALKK